MKKASAEAGKRRVLVVEDDPDLQEVLRFNLEAEGYEVTQARSGRGALDQAFRNPPHIVILDLMLPGITGIQVCRKLRSNPATEEVLVLMLTARGSELDRVIGFETGADDYVVKPFSVRELLLRLQALLRRRLEAGPRFLCFGSLEVDVGRHRVKVAGERVELTPLEFRLLVHLLEEAGRVCTRESLLDRVWGYQSDVLSRTVDTHIRRLRDKLGPASELLETVRGFGYRISDELRRGR